MSEVKTKIDELRAITDTPIITGFGIKSETQAQQFKDYRRVVIGSAIVEILSGSDPIDNLQTYLEPIIKAIKMDKSTYLKLIEDGYTHIPVYKEIIADLISPLYVYSNFLKTWKIQSYLNLLRQMRRKVDIP